jgi:hypothetical protein
MACSFAKTRVRQDAERSLRDAGAPREETSLPLTFGRLPSPHAIVRNSPEQLHWADIILMMENSHKNRLNRKYKAHLSGKQVVVLNIPDDYEYMDSELIAILKARCRAYLG